MTETAVFVRSLGAVTPAGVGAGALADALAVPCWRPQLGLARPDAPPLPVATCHAFNPRDHLPPLVSRRLDRSARLLAAAAREALDGLGDPLPWPRERVGVTAGTWNAGTDPLVEVLRAVFLASPEEAPPMLFPSTVANAPASQLGILERLAGPNLTFFEKQVGGLRALAEAARLLRRGRADAVLACGVDEAQWLNAEGHERLGTLRREGRPGMVLGEGAAVLLLAREPGEAPLARLAGAGSASAAAPPHRYPESPQVLVEACRQALAAAQVGVEQVDLVISLANGLPVLSRLERDALLALFGSARPATLAVTDRLGEGAFGGAARALTAVLALAGRLIAWPPPPHLAEVGFPPLALRPRTVLVPALAGGGPALALVLTAG